MMRICAALVCLATSVLTATCTLAASLSATRPNIVFILTDDQGYGDLSAHGNPILKTPNLDRLRSQSLRFTDFVVSPTCAPTRSAIMTGRHEFRNGITHTILERERMDLKATTVAQILKGVGYANGIFGKWHLGDEEAYRPTKRGFDEMFIHGGGGIGQSYPGSCGDAPGNTYFNPAILHNNKFVKTEGYCTDVFFAEATQWMAKVKGKQPFFCQITTNAPHGPYVAKPEDAALYAGKTKTEDEANFFGMIHNIDENVGKVLAKLEEWGIAENTLVIFMNDNGGTAGVRVFNAGMHGAKATPWMGGTRAMSFWHWPNKIQPADCDALTAHVDIFRTLADLAGAKLPPAAEAQAEGRDLLPLLEDPKANWAERTLFTHVGRWAKGTNPDHAKAVNASVRTPRYHLVNEAPRGKAPAQGWQLFDVKSDPGELTNIADKNPETVQQMLTSYDQWWDSLKGQITLNEQTLGPKLNPFAEMYWNQFGGTPSQDDLARMEPAKAWTFEAQRVKKTK